MGSTPIIRIMKTLIDQIKQLIGRGLSKTYICHTLHISLYRLEKELSASKIRLPKRPRKQTNFDRISALDYLNTPYAWSKTHEVKKRLVEDGIKSHVCEKCTLTMWNGEPIPLELHHIDGSRFNNQLSNLQLLCPNCHAQCDNNSGKSNKKSPPSSTG